MNKFELCYKTSFQVTNILTEEWSAVEGALVPLLNDIAFAEISACKFSWYHEAKLFLTKRFGKTTTQILLDLMAHKMKPNDSLEVYLDKFMQIHS